MNQIEAQVQPWSQEVGRCTLQALVPAVAPRYAAMSLVCACGGVGQYQSHRRAQVLTRLGPVMYRRAYYVCTECHQG